MGRERFTPTNAHRAIRVDVGLWPALSIIGVIICDDGTNDAKLPSNFPLQLVDHMVI